MVRLRRRDGVAERFSELDGHGAVVRDELTGQSTTIRARTVVNAAGIWAGSLVPDVTLRPSRGTTSSRASRPCPARPPR